ncbi:hypothetical protein O0L34_g6436 [Tuta absoluta]|nr:hypothetical protein O0L34_g6436 [Tuta absoluta]
MDSSESKMSADKINLDNNPPDKNKPKKRSLVERELETTLTAVITSPLNAEEGTSTSRYGRARRLKTSNDISDTEKLATNILKSPQVEKSPNRNGEPSSPANKIPASDSLMQENSLKIENNLENQIENIYNTTISLSRFGSEEKNKPSQSSTKKHSKVYMRKDLIQSKEKDDPLLMIKSIFSPARSAKKSSSHLSNVLERSSDKYDLGKPHNGYLDTSSVVKTLDFDSKKKKHERKQSNTTVNSKQSKITPISNDTKPTLQFKETKATISKSELFEMEAKCMYQVGDIAWARMGTFPFWPCIVTREPGTDLIVRKKLFGKIERDMIHVTFFGDNGRRSWIVDTMLRKYQGLDEFEATRDQFTPEAKKKDPRLYSAFFISDKKLALWHTAVEEADYVQREPKRLRIDLLNALLGWVDPTKTTPIKNQKSSKITRTDSDVSLSETLFDSLFSEDDGKADESRPKKSLDVSEVVTACLDNMAAKTGLTMIQRQSHMDIWLQKAKSKTPEKPQINVSLTVDRIDNNSRKSRSKERDNNNSSKKKKKAVPPRDGLTQKPYTFRKSTESQHLLSYQNEHDYTTNGIIDSSDQAENTNASQITVFDEPIIQFDSSICVIDKVESLRNVESATKTPDDVTATEVDEETIIANDVNDEIVPTDIKKVNDTSSAVNIAMDVDYTNKDIENPEETSLESDIKSQNNINAHEVNAHKNTECSLETNTHIVMPPVLIENQQDFLNSGSIIDLKENEDKEDIKDETGMSIDEDLLSPEKLNTSSNQKEIEDTNKKQSDQTQTQQNKVEHNEVIADMNMSIDDVKSSEKNPVENKIETNVDKNINLPNSPLLGEDISKQNSSISHELVDKNVEVSQEIENVRITPTNYEKSSIEDISVESLGDLVAEVHSPKMVPKMKLTLIKEANIKSFKITSPKDEQPKRRSSRKIKSKKEFLPMKEPEFLQYVELKQDTIMDEHPELSQNEIVEYLYKTWQFGSGILKSKSPTDFTNEVLDSNTISDKTVPVMKESEAKSAYIKEDHIKETTQILDVKEVSEAKNTKKRSLRLRISQSPSNTEKTSEQKLNNELDIPNIKQSKIDSELYKFKDKPLSNDQLASNITDCILSRSTEPTNASPKISIPSTECIETASEEKPKQIYKVTPKKRSLCLRITKVEPKVLLERKDIFNNFKVTSKMDTEIPQASTSKVNYDSLSLNKVLISKTDASEDCNLDSKRPSRILRRSKSFFDANSEFDENKNNEAVFANKNIINLKSHDTQLCKEGNSEKIPVVVIGDVSKNENSKKKTEQLEKQVKTKDVLEATHTEIKRSSRSLRKSKPSIEMALSEDKHEKHISPADKIDSILMKVNSKVHKAAATENVISAIDGISCETGREECANKQLELTKRESKIEVKSKHSSNSSNSLRKKGKSKAFIKGATVEENQENRTSTVVCKLPGKDTEAQTEMEIDDESLVIESIKSDVKDLEENYCIDTETKNKQVETPKHSVFELEPSNVPINLLPESPTFTQELLDDKANVEIPAEDEVDCKSVEVHTKTHEAEMNNLSSVIEDVIPEQEIPFSKRRSSLRLRRSQSPSAKLLTEVHQELINEECNVKEFVLHDETPAENGDDCVIKVSDNEIITTKNRGSAIEHLSFETDTEFEVPLSKRRSSLRLRRSESISSKEYQESTALHGDVTENKDNMKQIPSNVPETYGGSNIVSDPVESMDMNEDERISLARHSVDNISLASDITNGFVDNSSDKDFDPDAVSLNSLSSEISDVSFAPRRKKASEDKSIAFQKIMDSDNDSMSSLDNITLSELKTRSSTVKISNLRPCLENSMDSIKSDSSERRLKVVLSKCILDGKNIKLPVVKEVISKTDVEFEISQSNPEICTSKNLKSSVSKPAVEPTMNGFRDSTPTPEPSITTKMNEEKTIPDPDTISIKSSGSDTSIKRRGKNRSEHKPMEEPEFLQYLEMRRDALMDEHPEVSPDEMVAYLYKTWQYEESLKSDIKKNDEFESSNLVKGVNPVTQEPPKKKKVVRQTKLINIEKILAKSPKSERIVIPKDELRERELPKRKASKPFYKEEYSDIEEELEMFEIFKTKKKLIVPKTEDNKVATLSESGKVNEADSVTLGTATVNNEIKTSAPKNEADIDLDEQDEIAEYYSEEDLYFEELESFLTSPKPNVFKGLIREKVCEICEKPAKLVKCKGCSGMFHIDCVNKEEEIEVQEEKRRGRKKKLKRRGRKPKNSMDSNEDSHSDEKLNVSEENMSIEESNPIVIPDADNFESQLEAKMKEIIETEDKIDYDSYSSDDGIDWSETVAGKCEIVDVKLKLRPPSVNTDDFKCKNCQKDDIPICFVCKSPVAPKNNNERRQKCQVAHCHKYYHLECLEHWPQTQFNAGEPSRSNKKIDEHFEAMACPRHVCHTCVSDDPRGCKTRFSGDKLARCVRCPATYHSFTKCLPAGSQILSASHIVCPRHYEHRPGKIPYHVNTGWCFICALGGNLICCDYCPTSFHADCLNIEPPEGGYMCEDCETGRLPLYGEMVWVKLGHYRWWPGIVLHPSEIPDNIMSVKHSPGEFVVRFFGQYDHYWVNRGRVFPFQEGDNGKISTQKSKIDEAFTKAMEHAQRAFEILKNIEPNDEENQDIQSSLLPPHYVKLKVNKPCGALYGKKVDIEESSLTQCECNPDEEDPCGPYTHCLNRMLLTECGPICRAGERCQNRAFEKRLYPKMVPYRTPHRGWGLKTLEPIKAGQFVIEYVGELIDEAEFRRRMQRKHETRDENFYFLTLDKERLIDAGPKGNLARFMNHCCEPNCETQKWTVLGDVRVGLFALRDIPANTEVTFNYNLECTGIEKKQCMCGAKRCAGYIGAKPKQEDPRPKKLQPAKRAYKKRKNTTESPKTEKPKRPIGRPAKPREPAEKPRELTEIEKDLLIIKNATNGISSDSESSGRLSSVDKDLVIKKDEKHVINETNTLKRKRMNSTEDKVLYNGCNSPSAKRVKEDDEKNCGVMN